MPERFDRDFTVTIGGLQLRMRQEPTITQAADGGLLQEAGQSLEILRVVWRIKKTNKGEPNKCTLEIFNLSPDNRQIIEEAGAEVIVEAGYTGAISQIFKGDLSFGENVRDVADWVTTIEAADGGRAIRRGRIQVQTAAGASVGDVFEQLAGGVDLTLGNVRDKLGEGSFREGFEDFKTGRVLSGNTWGEMKRLSRSLGFELSIQDGALQLLRPGEATNEDSALVDQSTGLIGSPERGDKGIVKVQTLLRPQINPGRRIRLISRELDGDYVCQAVEHTGDTHGQKWYSNLEVKRIQ